MHFFDKAAKHIESDVVRNVGLTLEQLIERFLADPKREAVTIHSLRAYKEKFHFLTEVLGKQTRIQEITRDDNTPFAVSVSITEHLAGRGKGGLDDVWWERSTTTEGV